MMAIVSSISGALTSRCVQARSRVSPMTEISTPRARSSAAQASAVAPVPARFSDTLAQAAAAKTGMGIAPLPCFVGDADPELVRVPGSGQWRFGTLWLLTHGEARRTRRVKLFCEFLKRRLSRHAALLAGLQAQRLN